MISDDEIKARHCLAVGSHLIQPRYFGAGEAAAEEKLKDRCRACWSLRKHFPVWVLAYVDKWKAEGKPALTRDEEDAA